MSIEIEIVAFIASTIGVSGCIPQIHKILKTKDTEAISYGKYIMCALSSFLWIYYGRNVFNCILEYILYCYGRIGYHAKI
jgi:uncharacterized protein with PQ loop repeat